MMPVVCPEVTRASKGREHFVHSGHVERTNWKTPESSTMHFVCPEATKDKTAGIASYIPGT